MKLLPTSVHEVCWKKNKKTRVYFNNLYFLKTTTDFQQRSYDFLSRTHRSSMVEKKPNKKWFWNYFAEIFLNVDIFEAIDLGGSVLVSFRASWSFFCGGWGGQAGGGPLWNIKHTRHCIRNLQPMKDLMKHKGALTVALNASGGGCTGPGPQKSGASGPANPPLSPNAWLPLFKWHKKIYA